MKADFPGIYTIMFIVYPTIWNLARHIQILYTFASNLLQGIHSKFYSTTVSFVLNRHLVILHRYQFLKLRKSTFEI